MRRHRTAASAGVLALLLLAGTPTTATAAAPDPQGGLWYYTVGGVETAHATTTGEGVTIAVIDGPVNPAAPDLVGANLAVQESTCTAPDGVTETETSTRLDAEHATQIASLLVGTGAGVPGQPGVKGVAPGATLLTYSMRPPDWDEATPPDERPSCVFEGGVDLGDVIAASIDDAVAKGARIISMSSGGIWMPPVGEAVARAYAAGAIIVGAARNEGLLGFPAGGNGVVAVEMADVAGQLDAPGWTTSSPWLTVVAPGEAILGPRWSEGRWDTYGLVDGTSYAAPWVAGVLALAWAEHPEATGNQMIQALIRSTHLADGAEPVHDDQWGYGAVSVAKLVATDPTQFPDENPLLRPLSDADANPTTQQILDAAAAASGTETTEPPIEPAPEPSPTAAASPDTDEAEPGSVVPLVAGAGVLAALVAAVAVLLARRRSAGTATSTTSTGHSRKDA